MKPLPAHEVQSIGVDWLTATTPRTSSFEQFRELGMSLIEDAARSGNDVKTWKRQGYAGYVSAGVSYGQRYDSHYIQLRSDDARSSWMPVARAARNISRIDLQVTFELRRAHPKFFREEHRAAGASTGERGRKRNLTLITSTTTGDSIYLGQRTSDIYARCYDKGMEERSAVKGKVIRHELEFKRDAALAVAARLIEAESPDLATLELVAGYMSRQHLRTPAFSGDSRVSARACILSDNERRLRWLGSAVKPSVATLLEAGRLEDILSALGLTEAVKGYCQRQQHRKRGDKKAHGVV